MWYHLFFPPLNYCNSSLMYSVMKYNAGRKTELGWKICTYYNLCLFKARTKRSRRAGKKFSVPELWLVLWPKVMNPCSITLLLPSISVVLLVKLKLLHYRQGKQYFSVSYKSTPISFSCKGIGVESSLWKLIGRK